MQDFGQSATDVKAGMTLDEIAQFVEQARALGVPGDTHVKAESGLKMQLRKLKTA